METLLRILPSPPLVNTAVFGLLSLYLGIAHDWPLPMYLLVGCALYGLAFFVAEDVAERMEDAGEATER